MFVRLRVLRFCHHKNIALIIQLCGIQLCIEIQQVGLVGRLLVITMRSIIALRFSFLNVMFNYHNNIC